MQATACMANERIKASTHHKRFGLYGTNIPVPNVPRPKNQLVFVVGAGVNTMVTVAAYDKALKLSRASLDGPRLGQALNFQVRVMGGICCVYSRCVLLLCAHANVRVATVLHHVSLHPKVDGHLVRCRVCACIRFACLAMHCFWGVCVDV